MDKPIRKKFDYDLFKANDKIARDIGKNIGTLYIIML